jgi:mono/diheme cytochrome c family protein
MLAKLFISAATLVSVVSASAAERVDFNRDILPILSANCFECHGPDASHRKADLRLDVRESALAKRESSAAIVPGQPQQSDLVRRINTDDPEDRMPPPKKASKLAPHQIQALRDWIEQGAEYAEHWAFVPPKRSTPPQVQDAVWPQTPIDQFVLERLEQAKLRPADKASRETLIRRTSLDLIGLPPTPEEIAAFLADHSPKAYERLVDRLLQSPQYGERWGRRWLDVARYADSGGFETDIFFGHAWRYRDYVIRSFNADKPFNQFIKEQIAGDELYPGNKEALIATGLYTTGPVLQEAGMVPGKLEYDQLTDAADTTGSAFLGLTVGCARCHDHKYDPFSQRDYYSLQALFAASDQFDFDQNGTNLRGRAALKNTQAEFEIEQAKDRARREKNPSVRTDHLRKLGDLAIAKDKPLSQRVTQSKRFLAIRSAEQRYRRAVETGRIDPIEPVRDVPNEKKTDDNDADDNAATDANQALPALSTETAVARPATTLEDLIFDIGKRAFDLETGNNSTKRAYRALKTEEEKRQFLIDYGRKNLDLPKPEGLIEDLEAFRLQMGEKYLEEGSAIPIRVLAHLKQPLEVKLLKRGELENPGEVVQPALPSKLAGGTQIGDLPPEQRRSVLANWVGSDQNPLTARVIVNRLWQWHFGEGLVRTPNDFGIRGERPTHPELLDWLAVEFVEQGWSLKKLHRLILLSSAYQMSSTAAPETLRRDPDNRLLTRFQPHRLEAEVIWDSFRAVAGTLNTEMYGLPIAPPLDEQEQIGNFRKWPTSTPEESNRRAVYLLIKRSFRFPMLSAFDLPDNIASCGQRDITTVPNQALTLLNNRTIQEQAAAFANRLLREAKGDLREAAALAWRYAYGRTITSEERQQTAEFLQTRQQASTLESGARDRSAVEELCLALFNTNEFIYFR